MILYTLILHSIQSVILRILPVIPTMVLLLRTKELAIIFNELTRRGCRLLLSNSNTEEIRRLYSDYSHLTEVTTVNRSINAVASKRVGHTELLIRNYC